jgi:chemotaxis protein MotB
VPKGRFDEQVAATEQAKRGLVQDAREIARLNEAVRKLEGQAEERDQRISELTTAGHNLQQKYDEAQALNQRLAEELRAAGKDVDKMLKEKGDLSKSLEDAKARLEELRKAQAAADARAALFQGFLRRFKALTDAGQLTIVTRRGRLVLQLPNEVLFDPGQVTIKPAGKTALTEIAKTLKTMTDRSFQVSGHTDNVPIRSGRYASNWELSTDRAVQVVKLLVDAGCAPKNLSAAGYGEFDPVASNDRPDGQAKNRRIEITLQPNIEELVAAPELKQTQ